MTIIIDLGNALPGTPKFSNAVEATKGLVPNPKWWIRWPALPLKQRVEGSYHGIPPTGYLLAKNYDDTLPGPYEIRDGNVFAIQDSDQVIATFLTVDELLAAGWVVD